MQVLKTASTVADHLEKECMNGFCWHSRGLLRTEHIGKPLTQLVFCRGPSSRGKPPNEQVRCPLHSKEMAWNYDTDVCRTCNWLQALKGYWSHHCHRSGKCFRHLDHAFKWNWPGQ